MTTDQKGSIAEAAIIYAAMKVGVGVFKPLTDGERYDLIFDLRPRLLRVQCKWAQRSNDVINVRCYSSRRCGDGFRKRPYTTDEVDAIAAYCADLERCLLLQCDELAGCSSIALRLAPTKNNQHLGVKWADDFDFAARLTALAGP